MYTTESLYSLFDKYNKEFFDNELPNITLEFSNKIYATLGYCDKDKNKIVISTLLTAYIFGDSLIEDVLIHEMVHLWQLNYKIDEFGCHKKSFDEWANYIANESSHKIYQYVPLKNYIKPWFNLKQNYYITIGHKTLIYNPYDNILCKE